MARGKVTEAVLNWILYTFLGKPFPKLQGQPQEGKWYTIKIPGAKCSDGSPWEGYFKKGKENRVIVCFYGGGVSVDAYTAARPHTAPGGFYNPRVTDGQIVMANCEKIMGITGSGKKNPFRDWSVITIPYDNGDFHAGTGELEYKALDGSRQIMYYHGYTNYRSLLETCIPWLEGTPEALLITGGSAGGFGTALLADDVISHFPKTKNITVLVDSSVLICDRWPEIAREVWKSPGQICDALRGDNITYDALTALKEKYKEKVKILFDCSVRDVALAQTQVYFDRGELPDQVSKSEADRFQQALKTMAQDLRREIPDCGVYIWEKEVTGEAKTTPHTITGVNLVFDQMDGQEKTIAQWIWEGVNGNIQSYGMPLLEKKY